MTVEHRLVFDLADLQAIRVECRECRAAVVAPFSPKTAFRIPDQCPSCRAMLRVRDGNADRIEAAVDAMRDALGGGANILRFEFEAP